MKNYVLPLLILLFGSLGTVEAQNTGALVGTVTEQGTNDPLTGVNILIRGTSFGAASDFDGNYAIRNIRPGEYDIEVSYIGFERMLFTAIRITAGETTRLDIKLKEQILSIGEDVVVVGERPIFDIEQSSTTSRVGRDQIQAASLRRVDDVVGQQAGVIRDPTGVYIRGGRAYETGFVIDGVSASDPLAGTGFGLDLGANAYSEVEVTTGGAGVEYGDATSGIVSVRTQDGGERLAGYFSHKRDNPGSMTSISHNFFTDTYEMTLGGPEPISRYLLPALGINLPGDITFFSSGQIFLTNEFTRNPADQVTSSIINNTFWTPRQDNRWSGMFKLTYRIKPGMRLEGAYQRSLTVNQNTRMLQVTGDDVQIRPGYQFFFSQNPDNANTYAHASNLSYVKWTHTLNQSTFYDLQVSRLFTRLRADANGRDWRPLAVDGELDPASIIVAPVSLFDDDSRDFNYVLPGPGFANNGGLATLWHDHFAEEITVRGTLTSFQNNRTNRYNAGFEMKFMDYQWIDITRPWVGAPIITDGEPSISFRLGDSSDIWRVKPARGSLFISDQIRYQGLIANIGFRFEYWFPGKYVDDAVNNPDALIPDQVREAYLNETYNFFGRRFKMRLLPRISVSFPVRENQVLYFNYGHMARTPHPTFMYAGLDPFYQDRSFLSNLGNPNLNQEVDISYEIGVRNQITSNDALNISAFWRDKYDFITSERIVITDPNTGREVERAYRVNGDFARVRGLEVSYIKRYKDWFNGQVSATYSRAEGLSSTTNDALQGIILGGQSIGNNVETPLAWDRPWDVKTNLTFTYDRPNDPMFGVSALNKMKLFISANYRSGLRYTPYIYRGNERNPVTGDLDWRPIYEMNTDPSARFSEVGDAWYWIDLNFQRWFTIGDTKVTAFLEVKNVLNNSNAAIINPVTGKAYRTDYPTDPQLLLQLRNDRSYDLPSNIRDPRYVDPRSNTSPSYLNPANFLEQRHIMFGVAFNF
jgi:hypothetical protein